MIDPSKSQPVAFITGASSGLGALFARELAKLGYALVLTARRKERMETLAGEIQARSPVSIEIIPADLRRVDDLERLVNRIGELDRLEMLINNAGFGTVGKFGRILPEKPREMVDVHLTATVRLTRAALPGMLNRKKGAVINVSSLAAFFPLPGGVTYCATKAALVAFSQTLAFELEGSGVRVQALCPGFVYTEFHETAEYQLIGRSRIPKVMWRPAEPVIPASLKALRKGQVICIPGRFNRLLSFFGRNEIFLPCVKIVIRMFF
jgi:hypothetical protein